MRIFRWFRWSVFAVLVLSGPSLAEQPRTLISARKIEFDLVRGGQGRGQAELVVAFIKNDNEYFPLTDAGKGMLAAPPVVQAKDGIHVDSFTIDVKDVPVRVGTKNMGGYLLTCKVQFHVDADAPPGPKVIPIELPNVFAIAAQLRVQSTFGQVTLEGTVHENQEALDQAVAAREEKKRQENFAIFGTVAGLIAFNVGVILVLILRGRRLNRGTQNAILSMVEPLPPCCIFCCESTETYVPRTFYWTAGSGHGILGLIALFTHMASGTLNVPVCEQHRTRMSRERRGVWCAFLAPMVLGAIAGVTAIMQEHEVLGLIFLLQGLLFGACLGAYWSVTSLHAEEIQHPLILLKPVPTCFVERCQQGK